MFAQSHWWEVKKYLGTLEMMIKRNDDKYDKFQ